MSWKSAAICLVALGGSYAATLMTGAAATSLVHGMALALLPVLSGMLIGAVGVYLGSLGNLMSIVYSYTGLTEKQIESVQDGISGTVAEVRDDVLFSVGALGAVFGLEFLGRADIPSIQWPFLHVYVSKGIVLTSLSLTLIVLSFVAVVDCVRVMFALHAQYLVVLRGRRGES